MLTDIFLDKYPLSIQNIKYGSRLYVNIDIAKIQQFRDILCVPFYSGGITHDKGGSQSQSSQSNLVDKFLHNAQVVNICEINNLKQVIAVEPESSPPIYHPTVGILFRFFFLGVGLTNVFNYYYVTNLCLLYCC
ncbi:hypothetical protein JHK86_034974 [Glycine max]|nr:hypothetical protein JHK86_034974 [Glycine max]